MFDAALFSQFPKCPAGFLVFVASVAAAVVAVAVLLLGHPVNGKLKCVTLSQ